MLPRGRKGKRKALHSGDAYEIVRTWIDDAVEVLAGMEDSCALDISERGEISGERVGEVLGIVRGRVHVMAARARLAGVSESERK